MEDLSNVNLNINLDAKEKEKMDLKISVAVNIDIIYDSSNNSYNISTCNSKITNTSSIKINRWQTHTISNSEFKYGYIKVKGNSNIGQLMAKAKPLRVQHIDNKGNIIYQNLVNTHKSVVARADGLSELMHRGNLYGGTVVELKYIIGGNEPILQMRKIKNSHIANDPLAGLD